MGGASSVLLNSSGASLPQLSGSGSLGEWLSSASPEEVAALETQALGAARALFQADPVMFERIVSRAREVGYEADRGTGATSPAQLHPMGDRKVEGFAEALLRQLNALRREPSSFIPLLQQHLSSFEDDHVYRSRTSDGKLINVRTHDGRAGVLDAIEYLRDAKPAQQLVISPALQRAAEDLVKDLRDSNPEVHAIPCYYSKRKYRFMYFFQ
jgi:hypothetical protein